MHFNILTARVDQNSFQLTVPEGAKNISIVVLDIFYTSIAMP